MAQFKAVFSSHTNPFISGVAKFNSILARQMGIPFLGFKTFTGVESGPVLVSMKLDDATPDEVWDSRVLLGYLKEKKIAYDLFFHKLGSLKIEDEFIESCRKIYCGNAYIQKQLADCGKSLVDAWCPALLDATESKFEKQLNLFSFGMAHKIQMGFHQKLQETLRRFEVDYSLWVSTAFHEKANFGDFDSISRQLADIYGSRIRHLGFLSDETVNYFLAKSHAFVAFFDGGVRANNTSLYAAIERGCAVITNLDEMSPKWMKHGQNVLDIHQLDVGDLDARLLRKIGDNGAEEAKKYASWPALIGLLGTTAGQA